MSDTTRIKNLPTIDTISDSDSLAVDTSSGTKSSAFGDLSDSVINRTYSLDMGSKTIPAAFNELYEGHVRDCAGGHNSIYRGKNLGTSFTSAMSTAITNGTFDDLYVGDYLTINSTVYRFAGFNLIKQIGDTACTSNNACLVPDSSLYSAQMNSTNTTEGAYVSSEMRTTNLADAITKIETDFGSSHIITYRDMLTNAVSDGQASGWAWYDCKVELMSEVMVYGTKVWGNDGHEVGCINEQLPLFRLNPESIHRRFGYWLRSVRSSTGFARVYAYGLASNGNASGSLGVRPLFFVK